MELSDTTLGSRLGGGSAAVGAALAEWKRFEAVVGAGGAGGAEDAEELWSAHGGAMRAAEGLTERGAVADVGDGEVARCVVEAALVLERLPDVVGPADKVIDTTASRTLGAFRLDVPGSGGGDGVSALIGRAAEVGGLSAGDVAACRRRAENDFEDLDRGIAVVDAVLQEAGLRGGAGRQGEGKGVDDEAIARLFGGLYGCQVPTGRVGLVATASQLIFTVREAGATPGAGAGAGATPGDAAAEAVLARGKRFETRYFGHFPAFGFIEPGDIDAGLVERLSGRLGVEDASVRRRLACCASVLAERDIEKYVVHDVWGHACQALLLRFDDVYLQLGRFEDGLAAVLPGGEASGVRGIGPGGIGPRGVDEAAFAGHVEAVLSRRLHLSFVALVAELLADVCEYKVLQDRPRLAAVMGSSSRLKGLPAKLDLSLADLRLYFGLAVRSVAGVAEEAGRGALRERLVGAGVERGAADGAAAAVARVVRRVVDGAFGEPADGAVGDPDDTPAFTRLGLNILALHAAVNRHYPPLASLPLQRFGVDGGRDLLLFGIASFYLADPARNLWRLDEFITFRLVPFLHRLAGAEPPAATGE